MYKRQRLRFEKEILVTHSFLSPSSLRYESRCVRGGRVGGKVSGHTFTESRRSILLRIGGIDPVGVSSRVRDTIIRIFRYGTRMSPLYCTIIYMSEGKQNSNGAVLMATDVYYR